MGTTRSMKSLEVSEIKSLVFTTRLSVCGFTPKSSFRITSFLDIFFECRHGLKVVR